MEGYVVSHMRRSSRQSLSRTKVPYQATRSSLIWSNRSCRESPKAKWSMSDLLAAYRWRAESITGATQSWPSSIKIANWTSRSSKTTSSPRTWWFPRNWSLSTTSKYSAEIWLRNRIKHTWDPTLRNNKDSREKSPISDSIDGRTFESEELQPSGGILVFLGRPELAKIFSNISF